MEEPIETPKKKRVLSEDALKKLQLAREKALEAKRANKQITDLEKEVKKKEREQKKDDKKKDLESRLKKVTTPKEELKKEEYLPEPIVKEDVKEEYLPETPEVVEEVPEPVKEDPPPVVEEEAPEPPKEKVKKERKKVVRTPKIEKPKEPEPITKQEPEHDLVFINGILVQKSKLKDPSKLQRLR